MKTKKTAMKAIKAPVFMHKVVVPAGDIPKGDYQLKGTNLKNHQTDALISLTEPGIASVVEQTEDTVKNLPEMAAWSAAGAIVFGPLGLIAGLVLGGWGEQICSLVTFKPVGAAPPVKFLAVTTQKTTNELIALSKLGG
jgi:hypothetical protein